MSYTYVGQQFDNTLTALKGWPKEHPLDIEGTLSSSVNIGGVYTPAKSGQVVHITTLTAKTNAPNTLTFEMGAKLNQMPIFLIPNSTDFDVQNRGVPDGVVLGGTSTYKPAWVPINPTGVMVGLVGKGEYEFESTEFDTAQTYAANDYLRAVTSNSDANAGKLTNQRNTSSDAFASGGVCIYGDPSVAAWDSIVGRVSRGKYTNSAGVSALAFWPESLPGSR